MKIIIVVFISIFCVLSATLNPVSAQIKVNASVINRDTLAVTWETRQASEGKECKLLVRLFSVDSTNKVIFEKEDTLNGVEATHGKKNIILPNLPKTYRLFTSIDYIDALSDTDGTLLLGWSNQRITPLGGEEDGSWSASDIAVLTYTLKKSNTPLEEGVAVEFTVYKIMHDGFESWKCSGDVEVKDGGITMPLPANPGKYVYKVAGENICVIIPAQAE